MHKLINGENNWYGRKNITNVKKLIVAIGIILIIAFVVFAVIKFKEKPKEVLKEPTNIVVETPKEEVKEEIKEEVKEVVNLPEASDPNKLLKTGWTLWDVKLELGRIKENYSKFGDSKVNEEINRLPAKLPKEPVKE